MIKSLFRRNHDFIEVYDNVLSKRDCEILINQFEKSDDVSWATTSSGYEPEFKKGRQLLCKFSHDNKISNITRTGLNHCLNKYNEKYKSLHYCPRWSKHDGFMIQKYDGKDEGFKGWHCEHGPDENSSQRVLAWMFYLNDAKSGTEFMNFPTVNARMGRCLVWPSGWTHVHKGVIPNEGIKYVITGWISFTND